MSKKTLLNEASVRRFMKLADMQGLSSNFLNEMYGAAHQEDEPDEDAMMDDEMPEMADDMGPEEDAPEMDDEMPEMPEADEEADEVEITEDDRAALAAAIPVLEKIAGGGGADMDMDDMGDMDMDDEAGMRDYMREGEEAEDLGEEMHSEGEKEDVMEESEDLDELEIVDENKLVQEVTRRVAERLRKAIKSRK